MPCLASCYSVSTKSGMHPCKPRLNLSPHSMRSYVDDTLISVPLPHAKDLIASWEEKLSSAHLRLKRAKLQVYRPGH